jgi:hypothetical protein
LHDEKRLISLVSNRYWEGYPAYTCDSNATRPYGPLVSRISKELCEVSCGAREILVRKSSGLFLVATMDNTYGNDTLRAAKRAVKSKDQRARLRAAKIIPAQRARAMLSDDSISVRSAVIKRLGIANCADQLMDDNNYWIKTQAIINSSSPVSDEIEIIKSKLLETESSPLGSHWTYTYALKSLITRLPACDVPYHLDLSTISEELGRVLRLKMEHYKGDFNAEQGGKGS